MQRLFWKFSIRGYLRANIFWVDKSVFWSLNGLLRYEIFSRAMGSMPQSSNLWWVGVSTMTNDWGYSDPWLQRYPLNTVRHFCDTRIPIKMGSFSLFSRQICRLSAVLYTEDTDMGSIAMTNNDKQIRDQNWGLIRAVKAKFWPCPQMDELCHELQSCDCVKNQI